MSPRSSATPPGSQDEVAWGLRPENAIYYPTSSAFGSGSEGTEVAWTIPIAPEISATAAIGKRRRDEPHDDTVATWNAAPKTGQGQQRKRDPQGSAVRNEDPPQSCSTPDPQGLHHRSLLGPSLQQGWTVEDADGRLFWAEGSVEEMARCTDNTAQQQQQQQQEEVQREHIEIPGTLNIGYQSLLMATQADRERGVVPENRCRLCPQARFKKWGDFKRHCDCTETHRLSIHFCEDCGYY